MQPTDPNRVRAAAWILAAPGLALAATGLLSLAGAGGDWIGAVWLAAVLWIIAASLVQALWAGFRRGDWSAFRGYELPSVDHDVGDFAYRQLTDPFWRHLPGNIHYASTDDGTRFFTDPAHSCLPGNIHHHSFPD